MAAEQEPGCAPRNPVRLECLENDEAPPDLLNVTFNAA
jgi:hypothetical protein